MKNFHNITALKFDHEAFKHLKCKISMLEKAIDREALGLITCMEQSKPDVISRIEHITGSCRDVAVWEAAYVRPEVEKVAGEELSLFKDKINFKMPGGGAFGGHQDFTAYRHFEPTQFITIMIALDAMDVENGCLALAGNYKDVARQCGADDETASSFMFETSTKTSSFGDISHEITEKFIWEDVVLTAGEAIVFDAYIPHRSPVNSSNKPRRALFFTYNLASEGDHYKRYYDKKRQSQDDPIFHVSTPTMR